MKTITHQRSLSRHSLVLLSAVLLVGGCATTQQPLDGVSANSDVLDAPNVEAVRTQPEQHQNRTVRWGGTLIGVENREDSTWVEIIDRPLTRSGQPLTSRQSLGRFIAVVPDFLDPADYTVGKAITVTGAVDGSDTRKIGAASYDYPIVVVSEHRLWSADETRFARRGRDGYGYRGHYGLSYYSPYFGLSYGSRYGSRVLFGFSHPFRYGHFGYRYRAGYGHRYRPYRHGRGFYRGGRQHIGGKRRVRRRF